MTGFPADKEKLRAAIRALLREMPADAAAAGSAAIRTRLIAQPWWACAHRVLFFAPIAGEPDLWPLLLAALADKDVFLPCHEAVSGEYGARRIIDATRDCRPGRFGIREPGGHCALQPLNQLDLILVPGLAFDPAGRRLGRGRGFFDRLLEKASGVACGVAFDPQLIPEIPAEPHDRQVRFVVTPTRCLAVP